MPAWSCGSPLRSKIREISFTGAVSQPARAAAAMRTTTSRRTAAMSRAPPLVEFMLDSNAFARFRGDRDDVRLRRAVAKLDPVAARCELEILQRGAHAQHPA